MPGAVFSGSDFVQKGRQNELQHNYHALAQLSLQIVGAKPRPRQTFSKLAFAKKTTKGESRGLYDSGAQNLNFVQELENTRSRWMFADLFLFLVLSSTASPRRVPERHPNCIMQKD